MEELDYKKTINLPNTEFPMKADLPKREPLILKKWEELDIYKRMLAKNAKLTKYILHDGPPYANGNIHIGHALNKILKDIIVKYKTLRGFFAPYVPGWDCHGLPVEHQLFKEMKKSKDEVDQVDFRNKAHDFALKFVAIQKEEFKRLGVFGDWENPYLTLSNQYEASIIRSFGVLAGNGYIYKGCKPVNWCCSCETALAEAEVEYDNHTSASIFVKFALTGAEARKKLGLKEDLPCFVVIWTTTPWTLLGNVACAVHPDYEYVFVRVDREILIMEKNLSTSVITQGNLVGAKIIGEIKGADMENWVYAHPFMNRTGKVVLADYVSREDGSGIVHTAPGYGSEDFLTGKRYNLEVLMQVDDKGRFFEDIEDFGKLNIFAASKKVIETLKEKGHLVASGNIQHSYPHCWRCKEPIIFRATEQWFMSVDHKELRQKMFAEIKNVRWIPGFGEDRIKSMIENRPDWCLSRQRLWGVPIPVFYCEKCHASILDQKVIENLAGIVEKEGANSWFIRTAKELLPKGFICPSCNHDQFEKESDILDVWFDSGVSHQAVMKNHKDLGYPADMYLEGSDQHRGWFQASLITAMGIEQRAPFRDVLTHGFTVDGEGKKMSKSRGNVIAPQKVIERLGADVLRLSIASSDYNDDVRLSDEILARVSESYRKIRNTLKFILGNISDFDIEKNRVPYSQLREIDRWALSVLHDLLQKVTNAYDKFVFHQVVKLIYNFCVVQMSSFYLDVLKDTLYTYAQNSRERRSAQTVLYEILQVINTLIAPIMPMTAEEAFGFVPGPKPESIFLSSWPEFKAEYIKPELNNAWNALFDVRNCVLKELENARGQKMIGNSLEARVVLEVKDENSDLGRLLKTYESQLAGLFIVSAAGLNFGVDTVGTPLYNVDLLVKDTVKSTGQLGVRVEKAEGEKCVRCWNFSDTVGSDKTHLKLCQRCIRNLA